MKRSQVFYQRLFGLANNAFFLAILSGAIALTGSYQRPALGHTSPASTLDATPVETLEAEPSADGPSAPEATDPETVEPQTVEPESIELETVETESVESETAEIESAEPESVETESAESETVETETAEEGAETAAISEADRFQRKLLIQADRAYQAGKYAEAEALYRQAKDESWLLPLQFSTLPPEPFTESSQLSPAGGVYWREGQAGLENDRQSQALTALALLTEEVPAFIPGHLAYSEALVAGDRSDEAAAVLENALTFYPDQTDLLLAQVELFMAEEQWLEAAIASRQFVSLNQDHAQAPDQAALAEENLSRFRRETRAGIRNGAIANLFTGALGYAFTGSIFGPFTAANSAVLLLQGENAVGDRYANSIQRQLPMAEHPEALAYIRQLGARLAAVTGRDDLDYEFFIILDPSLNAFALPGGKIFVNAGAMLETRSEAELAGLLAHELAHSVLSHGFQIATRGNLSSSVAQYLPYGGLINNVFVSGYSRQMERQADIVGTQMLAASGYAADGLYHVMVTLNQKAEGRGIPTWLSTHPNTEERVAYLQNLVERGGYNRYAFEGVATHEEIQTIVARELAAYEARRREELGLEDAVTEEDEAPSEPDTTEIEPAEPNSTEELPAAGTAEAEPSSEIR